jgi:hypothetical protein
VKSLFDLDQFALEAARDLAARQPRCDNTINQLPVEVNPQLVDSVPIWHIATGQTEQTTLNTLKTLIGGGGGGGGGPILANTDLSALTVYNYANFGALPAASSAINDTAMTNMLARIAAASPQGGLAFIQALSYQIDALSFVVPDQTIMAGASCVMGGSQLGGGTPQFAVQTSGTLFKVGGNHGPGGILFQNIGVQFLSSVSASSLVFDTAGVQWNFRAYNCVFVNCPRVLNIADAATLSCGLEACTIENNLTANGSGPTGNAVINISGPQNFCVGQSEFFQPAQPPLGAGPINTVCIGVGGQCEHAVFDKLHISGQTYGFSFSQTGSGRVRHCSYSSLEIETYGPCVWMQTPGAGSDIYDQTFVNCTFKQTYDSTIGLSHVVIDPLTNLGGNTDINDIKFVNCTAYQGQKHGWEIVGGSQIMLTNCRSSGNNPTIGAGLAITNNCASVTCTNCDFSAKYQQAEQTVQNQKYAVFISGTPQGSITFDHCVMGGYGAITSTNPVNITGSPNGNVFFTNCPGYNDQFVNLCTPGGANAPLATTNASTAGTLTGGVNYYGPSWIAFLVGGAPIAFSYNGFGPYNLPAASYQVFFLASPYIGIKFGAAPAQFQWTGA